MGEAIDINTLDSIGVIQDEPAYMLPPEAFTAAENMRCVDGGLERMAGNEVVFGTPFSAPHLAVPISAVSQTFWVYFCEGAAGAISKIAAYDGITHANVTRQAAGVDVNYTATETRQLNATILAGIPIFNTGVDIPSMWPNPNLGTKMANLTNWPSTLRARKVIAFGAYLIALNILDGINAFPHLIRWSSAVPGPGAVPASWDYTDPAVDTGAYDLPDVNSGMLVEAMPLAGRLFLYKEQSTWAMRRIGGRAVFAFDTIFETVGVLAARCVAITPDGVNHVVATQDDLIIHNGSSKPTSVLNKRMRRAVFNDLDTRNFVNSFCFTDPEFNEVWFCYPQQGQTHPNRAVVFNTKTGAITQSDVAFRNVAVGVIESASGEVWNSAFETWDTETGTWSTAERRRLVLCDPAVGQFLQNNKGNLRAGVPYPALLQRTSLSIMGRKRSGEWIVNHKMMKFLDRVWPKIQGGPVNVRVGFQQTVNGPVVWKPYVVFDPVDMVTADFTGMGRAVAIEFSTTEAVPWRIDGYQISLEPCGEW